MRIILLIIRELNHCRFVYHVQKAFFFNFFFCTISYRDFSVCTKNFRFFWIFFFFGQNLEGWSCFFFSQQSLNIFNDVKKTFFSKFFFAVLYAGIFLYVQKISNFFEFFFFSTKSWRLELFFFSQQSLNIFYDVKKTFFSNFFFAVLYAGIFLYLEKISNFFEFFFFPTKFVLVLSCFDALSSSESTGTCWFQEENQQELVGSNRNQQELVGSVQMTKCLLR